MEDILKYFIEDYESKIPKSIDKKNKIYAEAQAILIAAT
jgi:hypothetical protein